MMEYKPRVQHISAQQAAIVAIFTLAVSLRLVQSGVVPAGDEAITREMLRRFGPLAMVTEIPRVQPHMPLYYIILDLWTVVFSFESARWLSIGAGTITPIAAYLFARELVSLPAASLAGLLTAVSLPLIQQSQWVRMYALLTLAVLLSWWAAWRFLTGDGRGLTYACTALIVIGLHPFGIVAVACQLVWLIVEQYVGGTRDEQLIVAAVGLAASAPLVYLLARVAGVSGTGVIRPSAMHIEGSYAVTRALVLPVTALTGTLHNSSFLLVGLTVTVAVSVFAVRQRVWSRSDGRLLICWIVVSLSLLFVGHAIRPILMLKYVAWIGPAVAILVSRSVPDTLFGHSILISLIGICALNLVYGTTLNQPLSYVAIGEGGV